MTELLTMRRIVLPQAMRVIIPPTGNETISMLKTTSLVERDRRSRTCSTSAQIIYARNFEMIPLLIVASLWYLVLTTVLTIGQYYVERHYAPRLAARQPRRRHVGLRAGTRASTPGPFDSESAR